MDDSQKKAPRKNESNSRKRIFNTNEDFGLQIQTPIRDENMSRFNEGIELDNIYNDEKPRKTKQKV